MAKNVKCDMNDNFDESGQALVMALLALAVGVLLVSGFMYYASTSQGATRATQAQAVGRYSADGGVEHALWRIRNQPAFRQTLLLSGTQIYTRSINRATVAISVTQALTSPVGGGGGGGGGLPLYNVRVEPDQASFVLPSGSSHAYDLSVVNAGRVADSFEASMTLNFNTKSGKVIWTVEVRDGTGTSVYGPVDFDPPKGVSTVSTGVFDTTPSLDPGQSEPYQVIITKGNQGGKGDTLDVVFTACSVGAAAQSPPETICDSSSFNTSVESQNTPAIGMSKMAAPFAVVPGDRITYTVTAENVGDSRADTIEVVDTLPAETEARFVVGSVVAPVGTVSYSNDGGTTWNYAPVPDGDGLDGAAGAIRWTLTDLAAGAGYDLLFSMQVNDPYTSTAVLVHNEAQAIWFRGAQQYGPTSTSFNNPVTLPPIYRITAVADPGTTIIAYTEFVRENVRVLSWQIK